MKQPRPGTTYQRPLSEDETESRYLNFARQLGVEEELKQILNRYKPLLARCSNGKEYEAISIMGNTEIHRLLGFDSPLYVNNKKVLDGDESLDTVNVMKKE